MDGPYVMIQSRASSHSRGYSFEGGLFESGRSSKKRNKLVVKKARHIEIKLLGRKI